MHLVLLLLLVTLAVECLCLVFDPLSSKSHIVGANMEELAIMELIAEQEGIQPRQPKKWDVFFLVLLAVLPLLLQPSTPPSNSRMTM